LNSQMSVLVGRQGGVPDTLRAMSIGAGDDSVTAAIESDDEEEQNKHVELLQLGMTHEQRAVVEAVHVQREELLAAQAAQQQMLVAQQAAQQAQLAQMQLAQQQNMAVQQQAALFSPRPASAVRTLVPPSPSAVLVGAQPLALSPRPTALLVPPSPIAQQSAVLLSPNAPAVQVPLTPSPSALQVQAAQVQLVSPIPPTPHAQQILSPQMALQEAVAVLRQQQAMQTALMEQQVMQQVAALQAAQAQVAAAVVQQQQVEQAVAAQQQQQQQQRNAQLAFASYQQSVSAANNPFASPLAVHQSQQGFTAGWTGSPAAPVFGAQAFGAASVPAPGMLSPMALNAAWAQQQRAVSDPLVSTRPPDAFGSIRDEDNARDDDDY
jgi:hypothetical protein